MSQSDSLEPETDNLQNPEETEKENFKSETDLNYPKEVFVKIEMDTNDQNLDTLNDKEMASDTLTLLHTEENIDIEIKQEISEEAPKYEDVPVHDKNDLLVEKCSTQQKVIEAMVVMPDNVMSEIKTEPVLEPGTEFPGAQEMAPDCIAGYSEAALAHVEACLDDIKTEEEPYDYQTPANIAEIKQEPEYNVTETHLISNKLINTTSTITRPHDGVTESTTTRTLVMQILPMGAGSSMEMNMSTEEILPNEDYDTFQLNSITGDELTLEQLHDPNLVECKVKKKKKIQCPKCTNIYASYNGYRSHLAVHASIEKMKSGRVRAEITKREKKLKRELDEYEDVKSEEEFKNAYKCTCGKTFRRGILMEACMKSHDFVERSEHYCNPCAKEFDSKEALNLHRKRLHLRKKFPCKFCPTEYMTQKELLKHLQLHQKVQLTEYKVISGVVDGTEELKCFICGKASADLPELKTHVMNDHKPPYICMCNKKIAKIDDYISHYKTHKKYSETVLDALEAFSKLAEDWKCEECDIEFAAADALAVHRLEKHTMESKSVEDTLQCEDCRRAFASAKSLKSHRRVHHSMPTEEPEQTDDSLKFLCVYCRKVCEDENALTSHLRLHSPDRKFVCKYCDFRFATAEKRKTHSEIHTGDLKFVCFICEYQCSSLQRLTNHKKTPKHLGMKDYLLTGVMPEFMKVKSEPKTPEPKKRKSRDEAISCDICGDTFPSESAMLKHKTTHPFISFVNEAEPTRIFFK